MNHVSSGSPEAFRARRHSAVVDPIWRLAVKRVKPDRDPQRRGDARLFRSVCVHPISGDVVGLRACRTSGHSASAGIRERQLLWHLRQVGAAWTRIANRVAIVRLDGTRAASSWSPRAASWLERTTVHACGLCGMPISARGPADDEWPMFSRLMTSRVLFDRRSPSRRCHAEMRSRPRCAALVAERAVHARGARWPPPPRAYMIDGWSFGDALYMVVLTVYTVGYYEVLPIDTTALRTITIVADRDRLHRHDLSHRRAEPADHRESVPGLLRNAAHAEGHRPARRSRHHLRLRAGSARASPRIFGQVKSGFVGLESVEERVEYARSHGYLSLQGLTRPTRRCWRMSASTAPAPWPPCCRTTMYKVFINLSARSLNKKLFIIDASA